MALSMTIAPAALSSRVQSGIASFRAPVAAPSRGSLQVMAASKKKDVRLTITLECTEQKASGVGGMSRYMSQKVRDETPADDSRARRSRASRHRDTRWIKFGTKRQITPSGTAKPYRQGFGRFPKWLYPRGEPVRAPSRFRGSTEPTDGSAAVRTVDPPLEFERVSSSSASRLRPDR
jgi:hypothetical protein